MSACRNIRNIVRLRQILRKWHKKANKNSNRYEPSDVPEGHVAVCVGSSSKRFVVRTLYLNHPLFKKLLLLAEEEYGFANTGPLVIPCDELIFEEILRFLSQSGPNHWFDNFDSFNSNCHVDVKEGFNFCADSQSLINGLTDNRSIW